LKPKTKRALNLIFKLLILVFAAAFIHKKLSNNSDLDNFKTLLGKIPAYRVNIVLTLVFLLMLANWFLEAAKWQFLVKRIQRISFYTAVESVCCGLTLAIFTPNRIGEYGGRIFFLAPRRRILGAIAMGVGAVGQMVITNILGACAILWFISEFYHLNLWIELALAFITAIFCLFFLLFYFNIKLIYARLIQIKFLKRLHKFFFILMRFRKKYLLKVFIYSTARFAVFTTQYCLIINLLLPEMLIFPMVMMIFILFFIQSALPSLDLLDIGVRSLTATFFFGFITSEPVPIIAATACIWLINLIIPAILGSVFVFKLKFFDNNN
jgi:uncharacterized membrane protein YbhN (UPF0104 family)